MGMRERACNMERNSWGIVNVPRCGCGSFRGFSRDGYVIEVVLVVHPYA